MIHLGDTPQVHAWPVTGVGGVSKAAGRSGTIGPETVLSRLRGDVARRPLVDAGFAGGLREWLEDSLAGPAAGLRRESRPLRVKKEDLNNVLVCEGYASARASRPRRATFELVRGVLVDALFRQWVTSGRIDDPWDDAVAATVVGAEGTILNFLSSLDAPSRRRLAEEVTAHADCIVSTWPVPSPGWYARTQERIEVPLAGGAVVLTGVIDLALGAPSSGQASVCLVEMKSGVRRLEHRGDLHYYALLETLRSGAAPFRVATYYSATGELDAEQLNEDVLTGALQRLIAATKRLCRLASGAEPARSPNPLCGWCEDLPRCDLGKARAMRSTPMEGGSPRNDDDLFESELSRSVEELV